ncbi:hypothetical protein LCGC14_0716120 [marine sediment metagenome]|uniref:Uncharacterized protein n=1 Tax=marine sediment metagenome TaxID=412755 RepID=A0A0F9TL44_9ZZZZ
MEVTVITGDSNRDKALEQLRDHLLYMQNEHLRLRDHLLRIQKELTDSYDRMNTEINGLLFEIGKLLPKGEKE